MLFLLLTHLGKTTRRLHERKMEHFKALTSDMHCSATADHLTLTRHRIIGLIMVFDAIFS